MFIEQCRSGEFKLYNGPRSVRMEYEQVRQILEDIFDEFNLDLAREFYNLEKS